MARRASRGAGAPRPTSHQILVISPPAPTMPPAAGTVDDASSSAAVEEASPRDGPIVITDADIDNIPIAALTLDTPLRPFNPKKREKPKPFLFLTLPSELRVRIYQYYFEDADDVLDLSPDNYKRMHKRLGIVRVCRQLHDEVTHYFYSTRSVRIFPTYPGRYFKTKKPMLARMKPNQRSCLGALELRLGPGFNAPPRGWVVNDALGLADCVNVHTLRVLVECDPSDSVFKGFRRSEGFYERFSSDLLTDVLAALPAVRAIEFDAWSSVKKSGLMMRSLFQVAAASKHLVCWGPERGWTDDPDEDDKARPAPTAQFMDDGVLIHDYATQNILAVAS